jgi:hypothetical protein
VLLGICGFCDNEEMFCNSVVSTTNVCKKNKCVTSKTNDQPITYRKQIPYRIYKNTKYKIQPPSSLIISVARGTHAIDFGMISPELESFATPICEKTKEPLCHSSRIKLVDCQCVRGAEAACVPPQLRIQTNVLRGSSKCAMEEPQCYL